MPHGHHIYKTASYMAMSTMCHFPSDQHALPHRKCVLCCCDKCNTIFIQGQESNSDDTNTCSTIIFHVYRVLSWFNVHVRRPCKEKRFIVIHSDINRYKWEIMHTKIACVNGYIHYRISWEVLHSINKKASISFNKSAHLSYPSLCQRTPCGLQTHMFISVCLVLLWSFRYSGGRFCQPNQIWILCWKYICICLRNYII